MSDLGHHSLKDWRRLWAASKARGCFIDETNPGRYRIHDRRRRVAVENGTFDQAARYLATQPVVEKKGF
jgi:hypothetical protein